MTRFMYMLGLSLLALACDKEQQKETGPTPDPITHPCVVAQAKFKRTLAEGDKACSSDADCGCYPGGIGEASGCGGVSSKATTAKLHAIAEEFHADKCDLTQQCAPRACEPKCEAGTCVAKK